MGEGIWRGGGFKDESYVVPAQSYNALMIGMLEGGGGGDCAKYGCLTSCFISPLLGAGRRP